MIQMRKISLLLITLILLVGCSSQAPEVTPEPPQKERHQIKFTISEKEYTLPTPFQEFADSDWIIDLDPEFILKAGTYIENQAIRKDKYYLLLTFYNDSDTDKAIKDTMVVSVQAEDRYVIWHYHDEVPSDIVLEPNIKWGFEETLAGNLYDTTAKIEQNNVYKTYVYELEKNQRIGLRYSLDDMELQFIELKDFGPDPNFD